MAEHKAILEWRLKDGEDFLKGRYSREHTWRFDGGTTVPASSAPSVVPVPYSNPAGVDPEEAFVASVSSCHMLTFLFLGAKRGFLIESYTDEAVGIMGKNNAGVPWVSRVTLNPRIKYRGERIPTPEELKELHHLSHEQCFIANSIKTEVVVEIP